MPRWLVTNLSAAAIIALAASVTSAVAEPTLPMPAGLRASGIPPIPPIPLAFVGRAAPFTKFKSSTLLDWHPTAQIALLRTRAGDDEYEQLYLLNGATAAPQRLTDGNHGIVDATFQPSTGAHVLLRREAGRVGEVQLLRLDVATNKLTRLSPEGESADAPMWDSRGELISFTTTTAFTTTTTTTTARPTTKLYVGDPRMPGTIKAVATSVEGVWRAAQFAPDGGSVVYIVDRDGGSSLWKFDLATGSNERLTKMDAPTQRFETPRFAPDAKSVLLTAQRPATNRQLVRIDLATGDQNLFATLPNADIADFAMSVLAKRIAVNAIEAGTSVLRFLDLDTGKELLRPALLPGEIVGMRWQHDSLTADKADKADKAGEGGMRLGFSLATSRAPRELFVYETNTTKLTRWTNGGVPGLNAFAFAEPARMTWKAPDGVAASGVLYAPDASVFPGKRPVLVQLRNEVELRQPISFLGAKNYLVTEMGVAILYPDAPALKDDVALAALLDWIATQPALDTKRVIVSAAAARIEPLSAALTRVERRIAGVIVYGDAARLREASLPQMVVQGGAHSSASNTWMLSDTNERAPFGKKSDQDFLFQTEVRFVESIVTP